MRTAANILWGFRAGVLGGLLLAAGGCESWYTPKPKPHPIEFSLDNPYSSVHTLAVAPAINLSGTRDFDPLIISDTLFAELQQVRDMNVLPLNKTLLAMQRLGIHNIDSPRVAQQIADALGADGLVIPAITAFDPYKPPTIGMVLQLYTGHEEAYAPRPVKYEPAQSNPPGVTLIADAAAGDPDHQPVSQVSAVFNANNQTVVREMHDFAIGRSDYTSAFEERRYLVDSDAYLRFVCHAMVRRLLDVERARVADR